MKMSKCHPNRLHWGKGLCKRCWSKKWYAQNKAKWERYYQKNKIRICKRVKLRAKSIPDRHIVERYGITLERWIEIFENQGQVCAICKTGKPNGRGWHTDHDHDTDKVRGILCHHCNVGIGNLKDSIELLNSAISYLRE